MTPSPLTKLRVAAINFLNPAPLMWDFEHPPLASPLAQRYTLHYTQPSLCAHHLLAAPADLALIPLASLTPDLANDPPPPPPPGPPPPGRPTPNPSAPPTTPPLNSPKTSKPPATRASHTPNNPSNNGPPPSPSPPRPFATPSPATSTTISTRTA